MDGSNASITIIAVPLSTREALHQNIAMVILTHIRERKHKEIVQDLVMGGTRLDYVDVGVIVLPSKCFNSTISNIFVCTTFLLLISDKNIII